MYKKDYTVYGFTLIELIVVLAGLGMLSSLTIPNVIKYLDYARVDEAKSLLNSTAADCLQELRRKGEERLNSPINGDIASFSRLKNTGYLFKSGNSRITDENYLPNCSTVFITAAIEDDRASRLPDLGFTLASDGTLTKISVNSGTDTKFAAESWAGKNTTNETELIEWQKLNSAIIKAKADCKEKRLNFAKNPGTGRTTMWDPVKTSKCTSKPPKFEDEKTCTADGCSTKPVWYLDGKICGYSQEEFDACRRKKTNAACQAEKDKLAADKATTKTIDGDQTLNCTETLWYFEGQDTGSAEAWKALMCDKNKKELLSTTHSGPVENCEVSPIYIIGGKEILPNANREDAKNEFEDILSKNKEAQCTRALNEDAINRGDGGPFTSPTPDGMSAPVGEDCAINYWYCSESKKIYREPEAEEKYNADEKCQSKCRKRDAKLCRDLQNPYWCAEVCD